MTRIKGLYAIVDATFLPLDSISDTAMAIVDAGARILQLRAKDIPAKTVFQIASGIAKAIPDDVLFIINDRADIAVASGAGGVHLGQDDIPCSMAREILGNGYIIGVSTHSIEEALEAERDGADYISFGPVFPTSTKDAGEAKGLATLREVKHSIKIPAIAIGGIYEGNLRDVFDTGVDGVAMISHILCSEDVCEKVKKLLTYFEDIRS